MLEDRLATPGPKAKGYAYPEDLARFVFDRWRDAPADYETTGEDGYGKADGADLLPDAVTFENLFNICYQASLLREEERPVTFRAMYAEPELFAPETGPPDGLHRLAFDSPRPFDPRELRRLSVATDFQRSLIGVRQDAEGGLQIWGLVNSGPRWLRDIQGGRRAGAPLPPVPVVHVSAPGRIEAHRGQELVGKLDSGKLSGSRADLFESEWLPNEFAEIRHQLLERHRVACAEARELSGERWAPLEPGLERKVAERMLKRVIAVVRDAHHGGTVIFVPLEKTGELCSDNRYIDLKYQFAGGVPRLRFRDLIAGLLNRLAQLHGTSDGREPDPVGWKEFEAAADEQIEALDEALFEVSYLIATLAAADGAVVMSKQHELLGFGGMISGRLPFVGTVARALDLEGERVVEESTENVGTRHRSAYRLAGALPGAIVVVMSQDGNVRFVCQKNGRVTYWDQG